MGKVKMFPSPHLGDLFLLNGKDISVTTVLMVSVPSFRGSFFI